MARMWGCCVVVALALASLGCGAAGVGEAQLSPPDQERILGDCPTNTRRLPQDAVARAADQAFIEAPTLYAAEPRGRIIVSSARATAAGTRGPQVREQCGDAVARQTVVVDLVFPRMLPSASLSQATVFVSLFPHGYRVWKVAH